MNKRKYRKDSKQSYGEDLKPCLKIEKLNTSDINIDVHVDNKEDTPNNVVIQTDSENAQNEHIEESMNERTFFRPLHSEESMDNDIQETSFRPLHYEESMDNDIDEDFEPKVKKKCRYINKKEKKNSKIRQPDVKDVVNITGVNGSESLGRATRKSRGILPKRLQD